MHDPAMTPALPTPEQMRNYCAAEKAAWQARRLRESSRAVITGNIAFVACLLGAALVVLHSDRFDGNAPFVMCGMMLGYVVCLVVSLRWLKRRRSRSFVVVLDRREVAATEALAQPIRVALVFSAVFLFQVLGMLLWGVAFRHMSNAAILTALAVGPALATGFFVYRFVIYQLWEDLLFAAAVVMAYAPFFLQAWNLLPLSLASFAVVIVGTVCLDRRWVNWTRSLSSEETDGGVQEVRS